MTGTERDDATARRRNEFEGGATREDQVSRTIVQAALEVHRTLGGPGLLESVYEEALLIELRHRGLKVETQTAVPLMYKGELLRSDLRLDLLVEDCVVVECKATNRDGPLFEAQVLTYLRLLGLKLGMVINFGEQLVKNGTRRVVNGLGA